MSPSPSASDALNLATCAALAQDGNGTPGTVPTRHVEFWRPLDLKNDAARTLTVSAATMPRDRPPLRTEALETPASPILYQPALFGRHIAPQSEHPRQRVVASAEHSWGALPPKDKAARRSEGLRWLGFVGIFPRYFHTAFAVLDCLKRVPPKEGGHFQRTVPISMR
jgi:hypothetical protein